MASKFYSPQAPTGQGGSAKKNRALNQLRNVQVLINSLPKKIYISKRENIRNIEKQIDDIINAIKSL